MNKVLFVLLCVSVSCPLWGMDDFHKSITQDIHEQGVRDLSGYIVDDESEEWDALG